MKYEHIFFDLDHTLWDADTNADESIAELFHKHSLLDMGVTSLKEFADKYRMINDQFWYDYSNGMISKQALRYKRFLQTLQHFGIKNYDLSYQLTDEYSEMTPQKTALQPHTIDVLQYLKKKYILHILSNGFEDIQYVKLKGSKIDYFFKHVITPDKAGCKKPSPLIFEYAADLVKAPIDKCIMIGDNLDIDIQGARSAGMDHVYYNLTNRKHTEQVNHEIRSLKELMEIL